MDVAFYIVLQFSGAISEPLLLLWAIGEPSRTSKVKYAATLPGEQGAWIAFIAEFLMTFVLMLAILVAVHSERLEKFAGLFAAVLIALYIGFDSPLSGMSLNPARTFVSGLTSHMWDGLWLYFVAPMLAALLATVLSTDADRWQARVREAASNAKNSICAICSPTV